MILFAARLTMLALLASASAEAQTMVITRVIEEIRTGDVVRILAGQKHWHGASPQASMTHIAITEHHDGTRVQWMEKVSDEQYSGALASP